MAKRRRPDPVAVEEYVGVGGRGRHAEGRRAEGEPWTDASREPVGQGDGCDQPGDESPSQGRTFGPTAASMCCPWCVQANGAKRIGCRYYGNPC